MRSKSIFTVTAVDQGNNCSKKKRFHFCRKIKKHQKLKSRWQVLLQRLKWNESLLCFYLTLCRCGFRLFWKLSELTVSFTLKLKRKKHAMFLFLFFFFYKRYYCSKVSGQGFADECLHGKYSVNHKRSCLLCSNNHVCSSCVMSCSGNQTTSVFTAALWSFFCFTSLCCLTTTLDRIGAVPLNLLAFFRIVHKFSLGFGYFLLYLKMQR